MPIVFNDSAVYDILRQMKPVVKNGYALAYINAALNNHMTGHTLKVQVLYILNNLSGWRGEDARRVKSELKAFCKGVM